MSTTTMKQPAQPWANVLLLLGIVGFLVVGASRRSPTLVVGQPGAAGAEVASLEGRAARDPADMEAVSSLVKNYLDRGEAGMAVAVVQRAPSSALNSPPAADLAATAYLRAGRGTESLAMTRHVLALCAQSSCGATLVARSARREGLLEAVLEMGIEDALANPEAVDLAYRKTARQVRIAMN